MTGSMLALLIGFCLDLLFGDPHWMPHPIRIIGNSIDKLEAFLRKKNDSATRQKKMGVLLLGVISLGTLVFYIALKVITYKVNFWLGVVIESLVIYQILAIKCLKTETMRVYNALEQDDISSARKWISYLVTRNTDEMTEADIVKAAVETISENIVDGITSPLLFIAIGGAPLGMFYKAVNTLDSMVGYRNDKYEHFGWASAKLDDILNFVPARLTGMLIVFVAYVFGYNGKNAWKILKRDKRNHTSPNSPYSEAPVAGALSIQLGGKATYFGVTKEKATMGDPIKPIERKHIKETNRIMIETSILSIGLILLLKYYI